MEKKYDLGNILQPNVELHQAEEEEPNGLVVGNDPKTAFLTELKELLTKSNADVFAYQSDFEEVTLAFNIGNDAIEYGYGKGDNSVKVTPSNIFDYDK